MRWFKLLTEELWVSLRNFFFMCTHVHKTLSNEMQLLCKSAELEIQLACLRECLKGAWLGQRFFSQYCIHAG